jgi:hypothetical protein
MRLRSPSRSGSLSIYDSYCLRSLIGDYMIIKVMLFNRLLYDCRDNNI